MFVSALIDRQLGLRSSFYYDFILQRLAVSKFDSYLGICPNEDRLDFNPYPPLFACRFAEKPGYEHLLALANEDGKVAIQNTLVKGNNVQELAAFDGFQCHINAVFDLVWTPGHMRFLTVSGDHSAKLWDVESGTVRHTMDFLGHTRSVRTAAFRPDDSNVVATGARDGKILVWDTRAGGPSGTIAKPDNCIYNCHPVVLPKTPGSGSKRFAKVADRTNSVTGLVFQDDYNLISCGSGDGSIRVWDLRRNYSNYKKDPLPKHSISYCGSSSKNGYSNLLLDQSRMTLFANCVDNVIYCFNMSTDNAYPLQKYVGHENGSFYIKSSLSPDSKYLVSGSSDQNAYIWNVKYSEPILKLSGHQAEVTCAAWCQVDDIKIVTCSDDARHKIWRIGNEIVSDSDASELLGRAFEIPPLDKNSKSHLDSLDRTPKPSKRKIVEPGSGSAKKAMTLSDYETRSTTDNASPSSSHGKKKSKRSLIDMMNNSLLLPGTSSDCENPPKRINADREPKADSMCQKNYHPPENLPTIPENSVLSSPERTQTSSVENDGFKTPTKVTNSTLKSPMLYYYSPTRVYNSPTANLPNFALDGKAPHLKSFSPQKKSDNVDWLTKMRQNKSAPSGSTLQVQESTSKKEDVDKFDHTHHKKGRTLLQFFAAADPHTNDDNAPLVDATNKINHGVKRKSTEVCEFETKCKISAGVSSPIADKNVSKTNKNLTTKDKIQKSQNNRTILSYFTSNHSNDLENKKGS